MRTVQQNYKRLGDYIRLVDERNRNLEVTRLLGVSVSKQCGRRQTPLKHLQSLQRVHLKMWYLYTPLFRY